MNNVHAGPFYGLDQGFANYGSDREADTQAMLDDLEGALAARDADAPPFFFFLMTKDAHSPYEPNRETLARFDRVKALAEIGSQPLSEHSRDLWQLLNQRMRRREPSALATQRHLVDLYDAALADLDAALARLPKILEAAGVSGDTVVAVIGDHGERFFEKASRGGVGHGHFLDRATLRVPLFLRVPGEPPRRTGALARSIDVFPTLAARARLRSSAPLPGRDLLAAPAAGPAPPGAFASFKEREHMLRLGPVNLYRRAGGGEEIFLSKQWRHVERPVTEEGPAVLRARKTLDEWLAYEAAERESREQAPVREVPQSVRDELRALGYVD